MWFGIEIWEVGEIYHGVVQLGTSPDLSTNIGAIRVDFERMEDDVSVELLEHDTSNDVVSYRIDLASNETTEDRMYDFTTNLTNGVSVQSFNLSEGTVDYSSDDGMLAWQYLQPTSGAAISFELVLDASEVSGLTDITPTVTSTVNTSTQSIDAMPTISTVISGKPVFGVSSSSPNVNEGEQVTLSASVIDAVIENLEISYTWKQVSGPSAEFGTTGETITVTAPTVSDDEAIEFELVGSNGLKTSNAVRISVNVIDKSSGGGSIGMSLVLLLGLLVFRFASSQKATPIAFCEPTFRAALRSFFMPINRDYAY